MSVYFPQTSLLCPPYFLYPLSQASAKARVYLTVTRAIMTVYIHGSSILNTEGSDCLPLLQTKSSFLSFPQCCCVSAPSLSNQIGCGTVTPWPICGHKTIPPKKLKDKLNLMPCNQLSRLQCTGRHYPASATREIGYCVLFLIGVEIMSQH